MEIGTSQWDPGEVRNQAQLSLTSDRVKLLREVIAKSDGRLTDAL